MWRNILLRLLVVCRIVSKPDVIGRVQARHPSHEQLRPGLVVIVRDGGVEKWACFKCPGGCGEKVMLPLSPSRRPHWRAIMDRFSRPTLEPSILQANECRCHFWVRAGRIVWCDDSGRRPGRTQ